MAARQPITSPFSIKRGDQWLSWQPGTQTGPVDPFAAELDPNDEVTRQLGGAPRQPGEGPSGPGSWVPATDKPGSLRTPLTILGLAAVAPIAQAALAGQLGAVGGATAGAGGAGSAGSAGGAAAASGATASAGGAAGTTAAATGGGMGFSIPGLGKIGLMDIISTGGDIAGKIADSRAAGRETQAGYNLLYDEAERKRVDSLNAQALADIRQREYADKANNQAQRQRQAANFMRMPNATVTRPAGVPVAGSNYGVESIPNREAMADDLERQAMIRILNPVKAGSGDDTLPTLPTLPELSRTDLDPSALDSILNYASLGGGAADLIGSLKSKAGPKPGPMASGSTVPSYLTDPRTGYQLPHTPMPAIQGGLPRSMFDDVATFGLPDLPAPIARPTTPTRRPAAKPASPPTSPSSGTSGRRYLPTY